MVARPVAPGGRGARKVKRAQPLRAQGRADRLHHVRIGTLLHGMDLGGQRCDIDRGVGQRGHHAADVVGADGRKIALQIDHEFGLAPGVEFAQRLVDPVGSGRMVGAGHDGLAAVRCHGRRDLRRIGGDRHTADLGGLGPAQDMDDHRQAGDVHQRLAGQARRRHAGGDQHQGAGVGHGSKVSSKVLRKVLGIKVLEMRSGPP